MKTGQPILNIGTWSSHCEACGKDADPNEKIHDTLAAFSKKTGEKGCGVVWTQVTSDYNFLDERIKEMRPDLTFIRLI